MENFRVDDRLNQIHANRRKVKLAIYYGPDQSNLMSNYSVNMSTGGVFIETSKVLAQDEYLHVEFLIPNNASVITCKSRVAWTNEPDMPISPKLPTGMGLQFVDLPIEEISNIRRYLSEAEMKPVW